MSVGEIISDIMFDKRRCLVQSPPLTLPHFKDSEPFFFYVTSSQFIDFSFFYCHVDYLLHQELDVLLERDRKSRSNPWPIKQCYNGKSFLTLKASFFSCLLVGWKFLILFSSFFFENRS